MTLAEFTTDLYVDAMFHKEWNALRNINEQPTYINVITNFTNNWSIKKKFSKQIAYVQYSYNKITDMLFYTETLKVTDKC